MNTLKFDWDKNKATKNLAKHKVSFKEAQSVFDDDFARLIPDPDHSESEDRFILLGLSCSLKVLVVVHCYKDEENIIRLISARKATKPESKIYKEYLL
ncbi:MAG: BrnT family toxin [Sulfurimonas sp.]|nr:BrnT family toxin [Sulfurimonas sp.]